MKPCRDTAVDRARAQQERMLVFFTVAVFLVGFAAGFSL